MLFLEILKIFNFSARAIRTEIYLGSGKNRPYLNVPPT
jgi:hypothetical protein